MSRRVDHLALTSSVEPAPPLDRGSDETDERGFTLLLSASLVEGEAGPELTEEHKRLLRTWLTSTVDGEPWEITGIAVWVWRPDAAIPESGVWESVDAIDSQGFAAGLPNPLRGDLEQRLDVLDDDLFFWNPTDGEQETSEEEDDKEGDVHVRHLLASMSTETTPVSSWLNLAWRFRVAATDLGENPDDAVVLAVPIFATREIDSDPAPSGGNPSPDEALLHRVAYSLGASDPIPWRAYVYPRRLGRSDEGYVDYKTGWLRASVGGSAPWSGEAWLRRLEEGLPDLFDLAQRLVDLARTHRDELGGLSEGSLAALRRAVLAAARDQAGVGIEAGADGDSLLDSVIASTAELANRRIALRQALTAYDASVTLESWRESVLEAVPELSHLAVVDTSSSRSVTELDRELAELDTLTGRLADPETLLAVVRRQWREATRGVADLPAWSLLDDALTQVAAEQPLRPLLARPRVRSVLHRLMKGLHGAAELKETLQDLLKLELRCAARARWDLPVPGGCSDPKEFGTLRPRAGGFPDLPDDLLERGLGKAVELFADSLPALDADTEAAQYDPGAGEPTEVPHPVVLPVARPAALGEEAPAEDQDTLRRIQGYAILMRELAREEGEPDSAWRCLNMARLVSPNQGVELADAALVPYRLAYRDGVKELSVAYDNQPLIARSPAERLARGTDERGLEEKSDPPGGSQDSKPFLAFEPVALPEGDDLETITALARLPGLRFGSRYQALASAVLNGGILAKGLGSDADPTSPRTPAAFDPSALENLDDYLRKLHYVRRVPVGLPRIATRQHPVQNATIDPLPPIPDGVAPLARELEVPSMMDNEPELPLVLLAPKGWNLPSRSVYETALLPPSTDLFTWDRWRGADLELPQRAGVWAHFFQHADAEERELGEATDLEIDDPASGSLYVEAIPLRGDREAIAGWVQFSTRQDPNTPWQEFAASRLPMKIRCSVEEGQALSLATGRIGLSVLPGEVWELRISVEVLENDRFHPRLPEKLSWSTVGGRWLAPPMRLLVEAAQPPIWAREDRFLAAEALLRALAPASVGERLFVHLDRAQATLGEDNVLDDVSLVQLKRQLWRWDGRLHEPYPFRRDAGGLPPHPELLEWEATAFAERSNEDHLRHAAVVRLGEMQPLLLNEDRAGDPRAVLYRFGLRVFSRYRGLVPRQLEALDAEALIGEDKVPTPWRRHLGLCRPQLPVPKPRVKLVVPLTTADSPDVGRQSTAGLLVVLDEPWYEVGGLAEELEVELIEVEYPAGEERETLPEFGPDPILVGSGWQPPATVDSATVGVRFEPRGPIGHTFDTDSSAPLFVSTSFYLQPPELDGRDLSWHFAKVRFRRVLNQNGVVGAGGDLSSEPTEAHWVQLLPAADGYQLETTPDNGMNTAWTGFVVLARDAGFDILDDASRSHLVEIKSLVEIDPESRMQHRQLLLLTRVIQDVRGREDEKYLGLYELTAGSEAGGPPVWQGVDEASAAAQRSISSEWRLQARIVEVQSRRAEGQAAQADSPDFWKLFFGNATSPDGDVSCRVVRVSSPIGSKMFRRRQHLAARARDGGPIAAQTSNHLRPLVAASRTPAELAREILASAKIQLLDSHSSGNVDEATALDNITDTSQGRPAKRSSYGNAPGGTVMLAVAMLEGMLELASTDRIGISEVAGGSHSAQSRHYVGVAFDVWSINGRKVGSDHPDFRRIMAAARAAGATEVLGPGDPNHDTHIHVAWPRPRALRGEGVEEFDTYCEAPV